MRLTKKEKAVYELIEKDTKAKDIGVILGLSTDEVIEIMVSTNKKMQEANLKLARSKDRVMRNEIIAPKIPNLKCKNLDADNPDYWFFTGFDWEVQEVRKAFRDLGISCPYKPHGKKGKAWLMVPSFVTGVLIFGAKIHWRKQHGATQQQLAS